MSRRPSLAPTRKSPRRPAVVVIGQSASGLPTIGFSIGDKVFYTDKHDKKHLSTVVGLEYSAPLIPAHEVKCHRSRVGIVDLSTLITRVKVFLDERILTILVDPKELTKVCL